MHQQKQQERYIAISIYEFSCVTPNYKPLFQECWSIIDATSQEEAQQKAEMLAQKSEHSYQNQDGQTITVKLRQIVDVARMLDPEMQDGAEFYARHFCNYQAYCDFEPKLGGELH